MDCDVPKRCIVTRHPSLLILGRRVSPSQLMPPLQLSEFARFGVWKEALVLVSCSGSCSVQLSVPEPRAVKGFSPALPGSGSWGSQEARSQQ